MDPTPKTASPASDSRWWGTLTVDEAVVQQRHIGPLRLILWRSAGDLRIDVQHGATTEAPAADGTLPEAPTPVPMDDAEAALEGVTRYRFAFRPSPVEGLRLEPALADRPLVSRPAIPLRIPPGEAVDFFVSNPLWIRLGNERLGNLLDEPILRPSETWFGPSRVLGELCYSATTVPRLHLENISVPAQRAVTPIRVVNRAAETLVLERIKVPVPHLELFEDSEGTLWTSAVELHRAESWGTEATGEVRFSAHPQAARRVAAARVQPESPRLVRALSSLFE
jgi:hypothetical protein